MASSAFSFHCMICFEEFDPQTNYPVVLPCGHTYVCIECANRLDKCMECRTPLTMKIELPPPPPAAMATTPATPGHGGVGMAIGGGGTMAPDTQKENQQNRYADRVRNSPGFRRRYGQRDEYRDSYRDPYNKRHYAPPPPQPVPKQRLPLPKNAVLLSLIQASEPARRRAEVEAPPTPQKSEATVGGGGYAQPTRSETPSPGTRGVGTGTSSLPKYSRPSPLFLDGSSSGEHDGVGHQILGSSATSDDEEHKIRVGTYLEGGPCGTYAVASKEGLLVYPTLFEHTLPSSLNGLKHEDDDVVKRDVEEMVKKHRASIINNSNSIVTNGNITPEMMIRKGTVGVGNEEGGRTSSNSPVDTEIGVSRTWVECREDGGEDVETAPFLPIQKKEDGCVSVDGSDSSLMAGTYIRTLGVVASGEGVTVLPQEAALAPDASLDSIAVDAMSEPGGLAAIDTSNEDEVDDVGVSVSLTISDDESDADADPIGASSRTLPARRSQSIMETPLRGKAKDDSVTKNFARHFSVGSHPAAHKNKGARDGNASGVGADTVGGVVDEFDRPLVRLKYGDRVQVVSMDARGWVKLARGYGYIRLENDKQLVKVGGTSDKACQIEAMLHELSIERNRLKHEQLKLERLSAGLMIDLQSTLISSDDHVVVPAPEGSLLRSDSNLSLSIPRKTNDSSDPKASNVSLDDLDISTRSRPVLTPPRTNDHSGNGQQHREIRTAKSHSPGRSSCLGATASSCLGGGKTARAPKAPPSPPYGQVTPSIPPNNWSSVHTPTRVNFRTGLSGHRALTSTHSHPHDFIDRPHGAIRSMSNHAGISSSKKSSSRGRSIY